jgi:ABC-type uncharacterized transport system permease subunit
VSILLAQTLLIAVPLVLAALAGVTSERAGVVNLALEAMLLAGAFGGAIGAQATGGVLAGVALGMASGALVAAGLAWLAVVVRTDQIIAGLALTLLVQGATELGGKLYWVADAPRHLPALPQAAPTGVDVLDVLLGRPFVALTLALVVVAWVLHERSVVGLRIAAIGEHPEAAETVGLSVRRHRALAVVASGLIAGLGGAYLALNVGQFQPGMSAGKGYIALAAVVFGRWRPLGATLACLGFAAAEAVAAALEREALPFPRELLGTLPYVLTIVAVAGLVGRARAPGALGRAYPAA